MMEKSNAEDMSDRPTDYFRTHEKLIRNSWKSFCDMRDSHFNKKKRTRWDVGDKTWESGSNQCHSRDDMVSWAKSVSINCFPDITPSASSMDPFIDNSSRHSHSVKTFNPRHVA